MLDLRKALAEQDTDTLELYLGPDWMTKIFKQGSDHEQDIWNEGYEQGYRDAGGYD